MPPLTRRELDQHRCHHGCEGHPIFLNASCHPRKGLEVAYDKESGDLLVACAVCQKPVARVAVAESRLT